MTLDNELFELKRNVNYGYDINKETILGLIKYIEHDIQLKYLEASKDVEDQREKIYQNGIVEGYKLARKDAVQAVESIKL